MTRLGPLIAAVVAWSLITACHGAPPEAGDAGVPAHEAWANDPRFADGLAEVQVCAATWRAVKLVYSAQDWCGLTFKTWSVDGDEADLQR